MCGQDTCARGADSLKRGCDVMDSSMWQLAWEFVSRHHVAALCVVFVAGLVVGGWMVRRSRQDPVPVHGRKGEASFFKGIQYILSNDHDHAIEEFAKSVKVNSDTIETYVALGNLYRSKGDIDRAIRIRHSIILRPNLDPALKLRALFDLGMDYRTGGFLNRALSTFQEVLRQAPEDVETLERVERIYEELRDWKNAYRTRQKIGRITGKDYRHILAHHLVESGKRQEARGEWANAVAIYNKAVSVDGTCVDAYLHLGDVYCGRNDYKSALSAWKRAARVAPRFSFLAYGRLEGACAAMKDRVPVEAFLKECIETNADGHSYLALAGYLYREGDVDGALREIDNALLVDPRFWEARKFRGKILLAQGDTEGALAEYGDLIEHLNLPFLRFRCEQCGFRSAQLQWQCPQCRQWDTTAPVEPGEVGFPAVQRNEARAVEAPGTAE